MLVIYDIQSFLVYQIRFGYCLQGIIRIQRNIVPLKGTLNNQNKIYTLSFDDNVLLELQNIILTTSFTPIWHSYGLCPNQKINFNIVVHIDVECRHDTCLSLHNLYSGKCLVILFWENYRLWSWYLKTTRSKNLWWPCRIFRSKNVLSTYTRGT